MERGGADQPLAADLDGFLYREHPDNLALALRVCADLGIDRAVALAPRTPRYRTQRAKVLEKLGRREEALGDYDVALKHCAPEPQDAEAKRFKANTLYDRGLLYAQLEQTEPAAADLRQALDLGLSKARTDAARQKLWEIKPPF